MHGIVGLSQWTHPLPLSKTRYHPRFHPQRHLFLGAAGPETELSILIFVYNLCTNIKRVRGATHVDTFERTLLS